MERRRERRLAPPHHPYTTATPPLRLLTPIPPSTPPSPPQVKAWQHERVLELLLSMLALTEPIGSLTNDLRALDKHRTLVCHPTRAQSVNGPSIQRTVGLSRTLKDEALALQVYERQQLREKRYEGGSAR